MSRMKTLVNRVLRLLSPNRPPSSVIPYISAKETIDQARAANMTLCEFVEAQWGISGNRDLVVSQIEHSVGLHDCNYICEIGPGTGRYLERILEIAQPAMYETYETASDWREYLQRTFHVVSHVADGHTLHNTPDHSRDLVHSHGLFVALPLTAAFGYFREILRVAGPSAWVAFDFCPESAFDLDTVDRWVDSGHAYPSVLPRTPVLECFERAGFHLVHEFWHPYGEGRALYFILRRS